MGREDNDMTLELGDDLLLRILSFLPTKEALRTSVLSKRWRYLWTSFSHFNLQESIKLTKQDLRLFHGNTPAHYPRCRTSFLHLVDRLLLGHDDSDITRFKVSSNVYVDTGSVHSWISAVIKHNVKELDLHFPVTESSTLPSCLFSSQSLTKLSIDFDFKGVAEFPSSLSGGCPSLKSLNLSKVEFSNDYSMKRLFSELSSIFPTLQQLSLVRCKWQNIKHLLITSSTLVSIRMSITDDILLDCKVVVNAPKLTSFYCKTNSSIAIRLAHPTILAEASLEFTHSGFEDTEFDEEEFDEDGILYQRVERLLLGMQNSKHLTLSTETLCALRGFFKPALQKLTYLDVRGWYFGYTSEEILELMHMTPNLECLSVSLRCNEDDIEWGWTPNPVPDTIMKKLKILKVSGLDAVEPELHLIKFFLENAPNLEEIQVFARKQNAWRLDVYREELVMLPRSSEKCVFVFEVSSRRKRQVIS